MYNKLLLFVSIAVVSLTAVLASDMKLYDYDDYDYQMVEKLTRLVGVIGPSTSTPVTSTELEIALDRVDSSLLPERYRAEYNRLLKELSDSEDEFLYDFDLYFAPQVYLTAYQEELNAGEFFIPFERRVPAAYGGVKLCFGDNVFLESSLEAINNSVIIGRNGVPYTSFDFIGSNRDNGEWHFISVDNPIQLYGEIPSKARGAIGNKWVNFIFGRSHHQMGSGYSGNMVVGDNYRFQEIAKLTATSNDFTYAMDFTHFDRQNEKGEIDKHQFSGPQVLRLIHRFDVNIMDRARIAANIGFSMYTDNISDMRLLTPLFLVHNWYNFREGQTVSNGDEANNIMSVDIDWVITPKIKVGLQVVVDQWQMPWESEGVPDAFGLLLNFSYLQTIKSGDIEYYIEGVYTATNLYLNTKYDDEAKKTRNYNYDFSLGYYRRDTSGDIHWTGHQFGPDALGVVFGANIDLYDYNLKVDSVVSYYTHGDIPFDHEYIADEVVGWVGTPEHRFDIKSEVDWNINSSLDLIGGVNFGFYWNHGDKKGDFKFIPQSMIGLKYTVI